MSTKDPTITNTDPTSDYSDSTSDDSDFSDDEKESILENNEEDKFDPTNFIQESSDYPESEKEEDEDEEEEDKESVEVKTDIESIAEQKLKQPPEIKNRGAEKVHKLVGYPRPKSEITDFREGFRNTYRIRKGISKQKEEPGPDPDYTFGDEHIDTSDDDFVDEKKTYEGFKSFYFSKEETKKREQNLVDAFDRKTKYDWFDFPVDEEEWTEKDNLEIWCDRPRGSTAAGFDPFWIDKREFNVIQRGFKEGDTSFSFGPFYVPYRKYNPLVTDIHPDARKPKQVIHELDMIEEFMQWSSCVFADGSSYEGTVWDDVAQGKGVYISPQGLVRYEGEWFRNQMEGHGVTEVEIPDYQPVPGSLDEKEMRDKGEINPRDFMSRDDRKWLEMDIEDSVDVAVRQFEIPFYETDIWVEHFGNKPETGRYRYAGQWKHGRMHGCGVYEVNERILFGQFYFGNYAGETVDCNSDTSAMHAGIAEVAAAKARMFMNKPDGMVREDVGPLNDPQHPYLYEDDEAWMAPGFVHQFYEVPDHWKEYAHDVDEEREMWLNSFYKAPLRLPMPAELEHWWSKDEEPQEFAVVTGEPEPDPEDPSKLIEQDPLILHIPSGRFINYVDDEEHGIRLYWQPQDGVGKKEDGNDREDEEEEEEEEEGNEGANLEKREFLPLGLDDFYGKVVEEEEEEEEEGNTVSIALRNAVKKVERWVKKKKKASEKRTEIVEKKLELVETETTLREAIEDEDEELVRLQKEEIEKLEKGLLEEEDIIIPSEETSQLDEEVSAAQGEIEKVKVGEEKKSENEEEEEEEEEEESDDEEDEEEDDEVAPTSFGSIIDDQDSKSSDQDRKKNGRSPFASLSLTFASLVLVPSPLQMSFSRWKESKLPQKISPPSSSPSCSSHACLMSLEPQISQSSVRFPRSVDQGLTLRARRQEHKGKHIIRTRMKNHSRHKASAESHRTIASHKPGGWNWPAADQGDISDA